MKPVAYDIALESMKGNPEAKLPKRSGDGWIYLCPAHPLPDFAGYIQDNQKNPHGAPVLKCLQHCTSKDIEKALKARGLWFWDKQKKTKGDENLERRFFACYYYYSHDVENTIALRVVHWDYYNEQNELVKTEVIRQKLDDQGEWQLAPANWSAPAYNWKAVREKAFYNKAVFCFDTEENVERLAEWDLVGFAHDGGSSNIWGFENSGIGQVCKPFGTDECVKYVVIIPELNQAGMKCARAKARFFHKRDIPVKLLCLPGLAGVSTGKGEGFKEWVLKGRTKDDLLQLVKDCPFWPTSDEEEDEEFIPEREPTKAEIVQARKTAEPSDSENDPFNYAFTDLGNALWFKRMCESYVAFLPGAGRNGGGLWFVYQDGIWSFDKARRVRSLMAKAVEVMRKELLASGRYNADKVMEWRDKSIMSRGINAALTMAEDRMASDETEFNLEKWKIACINGVVDLKTGELLPHDPKYKFTTRVEVNYDPDKDASWDDAPVFQKFMLDIFPSETKADQWKRVQAVTSCFSVSLTADPKFKKWFLLYGPGGNNGKSTLAEFMLFLLGEGFATTARKALICEVEHETKFSNPGVLRGKRFGIMDEIGKKDKIDNEKMKSITGNDSLTGDKLFVDAFTFKPTHYLYVYGNEKPRFDTGSDKAAQNRCVVIPFLRSFSDDEIDGELPEKLRAEATAVFAIMVWSCVTTWNRKHLLIHPFMVDARDQYMKEEDLFGEFIEQCLTPVPGTEIAAEDIHDVLAHWCRVEQGNMRAWHKNYMGKELVRRGFKRHQDRDGYTIYEDLQIKPAYLNRQKKAVHREIARDWQSQN